MVTNFPVSRTIYIFGKSLVKDILSREGEIVARDLAQPVAILLETG